MEMDIQEKTGAPNEYFSKNEPFNTEKEKLDPFKGVSIGFQCVAGKNLSVPHSQQDRSVISYQAELLTAVVDKEFCKC